MENSFYQTFVEKNNLINKEFEDNRNECIKFINYFVKHLSVYIDCPDDRIVWAKFSEEKQKTISSEPDYIGFFLNEKLALYRTGYYHFFIKIFLGQKSVFSDVIQLRFGIKKSEKSFSICDERKEITNNAADQLDDVFRYIVANILELIDFHYKFDNHTKEKNPFGFIQE